MDFIKKYNEFIKGLNLISLTMEELQYKKFKNPELAKCNVAEATVKAGKKYVGTWVNEQFLVAQEIIFTIKEHDPNNKRKLIKIFDLKVKFVLRYKSSFEPDKEIIEVLFSRNVPFNIHPYIRKLISSSLFKAGLPSVTLPLLKL